MLSRQFYIYGLPYIQSNSNLYICQLRGIKYHDKKTDRRRPEDETPVYSSEKAFMDYVTVKGIQQRIGVDRSQLIVFMVKELLDNALDFLETYGSKRPDIEPVAKVNVTDSRIVISNSNFGRQSLSKDRLNSIFTIDTFVSSKRNIYRISRGHLGDALKSVICIPYALATDYELEDWNQPMIIKVGKFSYQIGLRIDRVTPSILPDIKVQSIPETDFTTVEVKFPEKQNADYHSLLQFLKDYARLNPHITFDLDITQDGDKHSYYLPQTQRLSPEWSPGIGTLTEILRKRDSAISGNKELIRKSGWTQSTPYYLTRKSLKDNNGPEVSRKYITGIIKEVCLKEFNKTREELGIFAADRAQMYFRGRWHDVGFEEISELKQMGTDLLVIEKENVAGVFGPFADELWYCTFE